MQLMWFFHMKFEGGEGISGHFQVELGILSQGWSSGNSKKKKKKGFLHETN